MMISLRLREPYTEFEATNEKVAFSFQFKGQLQTLSGFPVNTLIIHIFSTHNLHNSAYTHSYPVAI